MYAKNNNYVTYFVEEEAKNTDKVFYGRVSEAIKIGEENGKNKYEFESWNARFVGKAKEKAEKLADKTSIKLTEWNARFVGKAKEKAEKLADKTSIKLTEWNARNPYSKEHRRNYPYLLIMDFEVSEQK